VNLLLFSPADRTCESRIALRDRRLRHLVDILHVQPGATVRVGEIGGRIGLGKVLALTPEQAELEVVLTDSPPPPLPAALVLALPRPKVVRRVLQTVATMGVKRIFLAAAAKVEKSYWQSPFLAPEAIREQFLLGLEQAGDTVLPECSLHPLFRPFAEDELPAIAAGTTALAADPDADSDWPSPLAGNATLAIGPEGGWTAFELELLRRAGFTPARLGRRILRTEQAVPALLGRML
jgi:RsmE family RNA methyltransferase